MDTPRTRSRATQSVLLAIAGLALSTAPASALPGRAPESPAGPFALQITLEREGPGPLFTLEATTLAPSPCFRAGAVELVPPVGRPLAITVQPIALEIESEPGALCAAVLTPVRHRAESLRLLSTVREVMVFTRVDGRIESSITLPVPAAP